jgi:hypothetical protein
MAETSLFGIDRSPAPVAFVFGGSDASGAVTNDLYLGLPTHEQNLWLRAQDVYGPQAGEGPYLTASQVLYHEQGQRLIVVGDRVAGDAGRSPDEAWIFELRTGTWRHIGSLNAGFPISRSSLSVDRDRQRAIVYGPAWAVTHWTAATQVLSLRTLTLEDLATSEAAEGPFGLADHGAFYDPRESALYVYGGRDSAGYSHGLFRLDLASKQWTHLGSGRAGPGPRLRPLLSRDPTSDTVWVVGGEVGPREPGLVFWGFRNGEWFRHETLRELDPSGTIFQGRFDLLGVHRYPLVVPEDEPYPGILFVARLESADPNLGLRVLDASGKLVAEDLRLGTSKSVVLYAHSLYFLEVVPLAGYDSGSRPEYTISVVEGSPAQVGSYSGSTGVNDLLVEGDLVYLVGKQGLETVSIADLGAPFALGQVGLPGAGQGILRCGDQACVSKAQQGGTSLVTVDLSSPGAPEIVGSLRTPGQSRSLGTKGTWLYLSDGGAGVSIVDTRDPLHLVRVGDLHLPGIVSSIHVAANRLYVATRPDHRVRIYSLTEPSAPVLLGELLAGSQVEAMRAYGTLLHVAEHAQPGGTQGCTSGKYCPRGTSVEVFDVSDPGAAYIKGAYDGAASPAVHLQPTGDHFLVRTYTGFEVYQVVPVQ